eukprot:15366411-Ditylum_brightwellii.AAC.1
MGLSVEENVSDTDSLINRLMCQAVVDKADQEFDDQAIDVYNEEENNDIYSFCVKQRNAVNADPSAKMIIGTAWTHKHLRRIFKAYGDVLFVDATEGLNDEERPLLALLVRSSLMKQVVVLQAVLPNNQRWVYRWFFKYAVQLLLAKSSAKK